MGKRKGKVQQKKVSESEEEQVENLALNQVMEDMDKEACSDSDDDGPESVSFAKGREDASVEAKKQAESRKLAAQAEKKLRRERSKNYRLQQARDLLQFGERLEQDVLAEAAKKLAARGSMSSAGHYTEEDMAGDMDERHSGPASVEEENEDESELPGSDGGEDDEEDFSDDYMPLSTSTQSTSAGRVQVRSFDQHKRMDMKASASAESFCRDHFFGKRLRRVPIDQLRSVKLRKPARQFRHRPY